MDTGFPPLLGYHSGLFDSAHRLVMEDVVSIVGFGDDNVMAKSEERTDPELQADPHKHTADDLFQVSWVLGY